MDYIFFEECGYLVWDVEGICLRVVYGVCVVMYIYGFFFELGYYSFK